MQKGKGPFYSTEEDGIYINLFGICKRAPPGASIPFILTQQIEKYPVEIRKEIVGRVHYGVTPLFIACKRGLTEFVKYLLEVCHADLEQKGLFEVEDRSTHVVTPLWCAAVSGKLSVVELLLKHGADINAVSDTGSTPVRSACYMTHFDIVKYLVEHGADINRPNYNGGTCLINSVQSAPLCEFLLKSGADVNARDIQNKTALHYAIQEHRLETTKLLLKNGADHRIRSRYGDDALQMTCLKGAERIFEYLSLCVSYTPDKLANAHELLGTTFLDEHNDVVVALYHWRKGLFIRRTHGLIPKQPVMPPREGYRFQREFETTEELENIATDLDAIRIQSLLILERILGPHHKDTIFRLMYRGASYADAMRHQRCIDLWRRALEIRIEKDSILYTDTCFTAQALVRLMVNYHLKILTANEDNTSQRFHDAISTFRLLTRNIEETKDLLSIRPVHKRQADYYDKMLKCTSHLIYLILETAKTDDQRTVLAETIPHFIQKNMRTVSKEDTLLHLCVSKLNTIKSSYFVDEEPIMIFPNYNVIKFLLECGAPINEKNVCGHTALHIATMPNNYNHMIIKVLLQYGFHIDQPSEVGETPWNAILAEKCNNSEVDIDIMDYITLKCLCANIIAKYKIAYESQVPKTLVYLIKLHES